MISHTVDSGLACEESASKRRCNLDVRPIMRMCIISMQKLGSVLCNAYILPFIGLGALPLLN